MKPVNQIDFSEKLGDCFRACVASIFEMQIEEVPNYWEQTQDAKEFWRLNDEWTTKNKRSRCINFSFEEADKYLIDEILCIAIAESPRGKGGHAVVWRDGLIHDPHPSHVGLIREPDTFALFIPLDPKEIEG